MSYVRLQGVAFAFDGGEPVFEDLDAHLGPGWTGLVGPNGAGKTTLLALIAGDLAPTAGRVIVEPRGGRVVVCAQRVDAAGPAEATLAASEEASAWDLRGRLGLDPGELARWSTLSPGERKRWQVGAALLAAPDVLLLDEPTNHLDAAGRRLLVAALARFDGVGVVVAHDRELLDELTRTTLRLDGGRGRLWPGNYAAARESWEAEARRARALREAARAERDRLDRRLADTRRARSSAELSRHASHRMRNESDSDARTLAAETQAGWAEARLSRRVAVTRRRLGKAAAAVGDASVERERGGELFVGWEPAPAPVLGVLDLAALRAGERVLAAGVRLTVKRDTRAWIAGPNGAGKTTLLAALCRVSRVPAERWLHLPQDLGADGEREVLAKVRRLEPSARGRVLALVDTLGVDPGRLLASRAPSPGEARKLALALGLGAHAWLLTLDEPTNHLDLPAIERLEEALAGYPGALLLVTHDAALAAACTREVWRLADGRLETS